MNAALAVLAVCGVALAQRGPSPDETARMEQAIPAKAPAKPRQARRILVTDLNVGRGGHPSIPYAKLALQMMAKRTGAFEPVFDNSREMLSAEALKKFDAIFLNSTIGPIFNTPELQKSLLDFIRGGGGLAGYHAAPFTSTDWPEFSALLGAKNGYHREPTERATIRVDDAKSPLTKPFRGKTVQFTDEFFRFFDAPYDPARLHILVSIDTERTDMNQGQCGGPSKRPYPPSVRCTREDNLYPISWVRREGKGRVFYTSLGHGGANFLDPLFLEHLLAGVQFALGDLKTNTAPGNVKPR